MLLAVSGIFAGCSNEQPQQETKDQDTQNQGKTENQQISDEKALKLSRVEWPGVTQKSYVLKDIFETLGYDVSLEAYTVPLVLKGLETGDLDAFAGTWFQTFGEPLQNRLDAGSIKVASVQIENSTYRPAVPTYVFEAGVKSLAGLAEHAEKFDYKYYGIEPGNDGNQIMLDAVENDTYGLADWTVVESSTSAMLAQVESTIENEDWIVFSGWKPHWMNVVLDMKYLDDPEGIWGGDERIGTVVTSSFPEKSPNAFKLLEQFDIDSDIQSAWILEYGKNGRKPEEVAKEWITNNVDLVSEWVQGVKSFDGRNAEDVLREAY